MVSERDVGRIIEARLQKARRFRDTARAMRREKDYDSALSRCHYSAFHAMKAALLRFGARAGREQVTHATLVDQFVRLAERLSWIQSITVPSKHRHLRRILKWLGDRREDADYEPGAPISQHDASEAITFVATLVEVVERRTR
ncbi:MAG: HEPN domain-containing protein [Chloroflexi bacterium]|nr:HEPN domain-containing protein [Chloroflexota bacterium]